MPTLSRVSSTSSATRKVRTRQYHTVSNTSRVDETLFGLPNHVQQRLQNLDKGLTRQDRDVSTIEKLVENRNARLRNNPHDKDVQQLITADLIRNIIIPTEDPSGKTIILKQYEFDRIKKASKYITKEQREAYEKQMKSENEAAMEACGARKKFMKQMDLKLQKNQKLSDLEMEAKEKAESLLAKANEMRTEQEDEIKHLNELMMEAKCHAIRDAQVDEKMQIKKDIVEEENRLDTMMEVDRQNSIKIQEDILKQRKEEQMLGARKLLEQIKEIEQEKLLALEHKDQENLQMRKYIEKVMEEDLIHEQNMKIRQEELRNDLNKANEEIQKRRNLKLEQEKLEDFKVLEYMRQKNERELAFEKEQEKIRIEKEKEIARLRSLQERAKDELAERDELRARRAMEQAEREWRRKEVEDARKKAETEAMLIAARQQQMANKEHFLAVEAQRERVEFESILRAQKEVVEKEKREESKAQQRNRKNVLELKEQIREKENEKINAKASFFEEGKRLKEEAQLRRQKLDALKQKKLSELKSAGIQDKYLFHVEKEVYAPKKLFA